MAEMERFARRGRRAGTHAGTETCPRHVSLALLVPCSNLSRLSLPKEKATRWVAFLLVKDCFFNKMRVIVVFY